MNGAKVLLIDSDADSIAIYSLILQHHGFVVVQALDADTGYRLAIDDRPDLVITELFLPLVQGKSLLDRLLADDRTASVPLLVLDSIPPFGDSLGSRVNAQNRLTKPCEPSRLLQEVQRLLAQSVPLTT
jgi:DNA-binding response OmpR family regulator